MLLLLDISFNAVLNKIPAQPFVFANSQEQIKIFFTWKSIPFLH